MEGGQDGGGAGGYLLFVWRPTGYRLEQRQGAPPPVGSEVDLAEGTQRVIKVGPSPLPGDPRPCAYLQA